jgi:glycosyltransferase involved in cell wall biosynthesis
MKVSIVVATYEAKGKGVDLLEDLFNSILSQTYKDVEIVVSDHSVDDVIKEYVDTWSDRMNMVYIRTERGRGNSSINMNEGIKVSTGDYIKIMHMDDQFCNNNALELMISGISENEKVKWGAFGFNHLYEPKGDIRREIVPHFYNNLTMSASSLIGCPSVSFFINDGTNLFDEEMIIVNDFDMHYRLNKKYGNPLIISDISVTVRMHADQVTNSLSTYNEKEKEEMDYFKTKNTI